MREFTEEMRFLPVAEGNHLVAIDLKNTQRKGMDNDDDYFNEVDPEGNVVAKYYTWHHMSIYPPQTVHSEGWIKYDLEGKKIASGSRKS
ncbi:hypothetical protein M2404_001456 [Rheinheimera pacifica]|uniref:hypothetical protein n=1 Tax=Rheinheimera pacifica TaxID=173990 RepID=UPI00216A9204|nr:hypothetical protein [Rheinheimera pacifica]MCS4307129.1 hypothetical protein [Rheinheimera pacifica]